MNGSQEEEESLSARRSTTQQQQDGEEQEEPEAGESIADQVKKHREFMKAGAGMVIGAGGSYYKALLARDELRQRSFRGAAAARKTANIALEKPPSETPLLSPGLRPLEMSRFDRRREGYFEASRQRDPGPLSRFGRGDGSWFDVNVRANFLNESGRS